MNRRRLILLVLLIVAAVVAGVVGSEFVSHLYKQDPLAKGVIEYVRTNVDSKSYGKEMQMDVVRKTVIAPLGATDEVRKYTVRISGTEKSSYVVVLVSKRSSGGYSFSLER